MNDREYWLAKFSGEWPRTTFPADLDGPPLGGSGGGRLDFKVSTVSTVSPGSGRRLLEIANHSDLRLYIFLATALSVLVHRYTGWEDIGLGAPIYRQPSEQSFINTVVAFRLRLAPQLPFKGLLLAMGEEIFSANEHQNYPLGELIEWLRPEPGQGRDGDDPLFGLAVLLENIHEPKYIEDLHLDMVFSFRRQEECVRAEVRYDRRLYSGEMVERLMAHFHRLLAVVVFDPDVPIGEIEILSAQERRHLLHHLNDTEAAYPEETTLRALFEMQVEEGPERTALVEEGGQAANRHLTYGALNRRANRLGRYLQNRGVGPGEIVGILLERSLELFIGILGVLKAGGAYLPLDPHYPRSRILSILADCRVSVLLGESRVLERHSFTALQNTRQIAQKPYVTGARQPISDFDSLPIPDRSLVDYEKYSRCIAEAMVTDCISIQASRGCPYGCLYCQRLWTRGHVRRSAENTFAEVKLYYDMGVRRFSFVDDIFNLDIDNSSRFLELVTQAGLDVQLFFPNGLRGDLLTHDYIDSMVRAGLVSLGLALETASPRLQRLIGKNLDIEKLRHNLEYICREYPQVILELYVMHGLPTETEEEALATMAFVKSIKWLHFPYINLLKIWVNSDMEKLALENGISRRIIEESEDRLFHEIPRYLPFDPLFTRKYQADFIDQYFLSRERLLQVLPDQMRVLSEDDLVQKYDSYLPVDIRCFDDLLQLSGIGRVELAGAEFLEADSLEVPHLNDRLRRHFSPLPEADGAFRILLLDLSQFFSQMKRRLDNLVESPLGLMYLATYLQRQFGSRVTVRIAKSMVDFDDYRQLKELLEEFKPRLIGIRTLTYYKDFFHQTAAVIRQWGIDVPIVTGGPYATSHYETILQDKNIDLVVRGEGEVTFAHLVGRMLEHPGRPLPAETLRQIEGIAFMPPVEEPGRGPAREIILLDTPAGEPTGGPAGNPGQSARPTDLCYVIYTSGSTGLPKGVAVEQRSAAAYVQAFLQEFDIRREDTVLQQASPAFDAFVEEMFPVLSRGGKLAIPADCDIGDVNRLGRFIGRQRVSVVTCSPLLLNALNQLEPPDSLAPVHTFISGGDVLRAEYVDRLRQKGKVYNTYGPTETTVCATFHRDRGGDGSRPAIGRPIANYRVYILDGNRQLLPQGVAGELCIAGDGLSRGYLNNPELTAERFLNAAAKNREDTRSPTHKILNPKSQPLYRTGDRARWLPGGTLDFLGRIDRQVKIRGYRIELAEIENRLRGVAEIEEALVTVRTDKTGDRYLCGYVVPRAGLALPALEPARLREHLARELPAYMIPAHFVALKAIPQTAAGKPDLRALPEPVPGSKVPRYIPWEMAQTVGTECRDRTGTGEVEADGVWPVAMDGYLPLSHAQRLIYLTEKIYPATSCETVAFTVNYGRGLDRARLEQAVNVVICKNEGLRLRLEEVEHGGSLGPVQYAADFKAVKPDYLDFSGAGGERRLSEWIAADVRRPFKLTGSDLFYFALVKFAGEEMGCYVKLHHLISDVWTFTLIFREIGQVYRQLEAGRAVDTGPNPSYRQYVRDEGAYLKSDRFRRDRQFWHKTLFPLPPETDIFFRQDDAGGIEGDSLTLPFSRELRRKMHEYCRDQRTSIYKLVLSALSIYISKLTAEDDVIIGSVNHNRSTDAHRQMAGIFIAIFPVRIRLSARMRFRDFVAEVGKNLDSIIKNHRRYPFDILAADIRKQGRGEAAALLNVNLIGHRRSAGEPFTVSHHFQGDEANPLSIHIDFSNRDAAGVLELEWDFQVRWFSRPDIAALHRGLAGLLEELLDFPDRRLADVTPPFPGEEEQNPDRRQQWLQRRRQRLEEAAGSFGPRHDGGDGEPADEVERRISKLWQEVLGLDAKKTALDVNADFFELGGHSLKATILTAKIQKTFNVKISLAEIFKAPTIRGLSACVAEAMKAEFVSLRAAEKKEYYPVSSAQKRLYFLQQLDVASRGYNSPSMVVMEGKIHREKLAATFGRLIDRHESLRTSFVLIRGKPVQKIHDHREFEVEFHDLTADSCRGESLYSRQDHIIDNFIRPFDLSAAPLLRAGLIKTDEHRHILMLDMHHIITDGASMAVLLKEFMQVYAKGDLPGRPRQYRDFSEWQKEMISTGVFKSQEDYWLKELAGEIPTLNLPLDYARPIMQSFEGSSIAFEIGQRETAALKTLCLEGDATLFMVLLSIYYVVLSKLSGQEDIVIGTFTSGRRHLDLEPIVGMFVNTLPLRNYPERGKTFRDFLREVKERVLQAFENQDFQFEDLVDRLSLKRDMGRNPLFDVLFMLNNLDFPEVEIPGLTLKSFEYRHGISKFDFTLSGVEVGDSLLFNIEYATKLFKVEKIELVIDYFKRLVSLVLRNPDEKIGKLEIVSEREREEISLQLVDDLENE